MVYSIGISSKCRSDLCLFRSMYNSILCFMIKSDLDILYIYIIFKFGKLSLFTTMNKIAKINIFNWF